MTETVNLLERDAEIESRARELASLNASAAAIKEAQTRVKSRLTELLAGQVGDVTVNGRVVLEVSYGRRFDAGLAAEVLALASAATVAACSRLDAAAAKAVLPPATYALCQKPNDAPTIKPKVAA